MAGAAAPTWGMPETPGATTGPTPWSGVMGNGAASIPLTRLLRPRATRMVAGVCAGLAQHYRWDLTWTRVLTVLIALFSSGAGVVAYVVFWIVMPEEPWMLTSGVVGSAGSAPGSTSTTREV